MLSNPHPPEPARWILEMSVLDISAWYRAFNELERKPLSALEEMLVHGFDRYLGRKGYLTKTQVEVLRGIAKKHDVPLPQIPLIAHHAQNHTKQELNPLSVLFPETKNPIKLEEAEVVKPEVLAKWREWGVPENIIQRAIKQRSLILQIRREEEWITIPDFAYKMPRLQKIEANSWGFAKIIDTEGTILEDRMRKDKVKKIDRWLYRWEYIYPVVIVKTRNYDLTEEIANLQNVRVTISREWDIRLNRYAIYYGCRSTTARAVRLCYLIQPYLVIPDKIARAKQILIKYKNRSAIPVPPS